MTLPLQAGQTVTWSFPILNDVGLLGIILYTRAAHLLGAMQYDLTNAQDLLEVI